MKMTMTTAITGRMLLLTAAALSVPAFAPMAHATHKNWLLKDSGNHCNFVVADHRNNSYGADALNAGEDGRFIECPVSLAGRWGTSAPSSFAPARWAKAMWGNVYVETQSTTANVWCQATATMASGSQYWGLSAGTFGRTGKITLEVNNGRNWGADLQAHSTEVVKALVYECQLPSGASINGYKVKICQWDPNCRDNNPNDSDADSRQSSSLVQTSGFDCTGPTSNYARGLNGITNTNPTWPHTLTCPLIPPADDSYEHTREIKQTRVYYTGGSRGTSCVASGTCPSCILGWLDRRSAAGFQTSTTPFVYTTDSLTQRTFLQQPTTTFSLGAEVNAVVFCTTPPGVTINGVTSSFSTTRNSAGQ